MSINLNFKVIWCKLISVCFFYYSHCQDAITIQIDFDSNRKWKVNDTIPIRLTINNDSNKTISFIYPEGQFQIKSNMCLGFYLEWLQQGKAKLNDFDKIRIPSRSDYVKLKPNQSKSLNFRIIPIALNKSLMFISEPQDFVLNISYCDKVLKRKNSIKFLSSCSFSLEVHKM